MMISLGYNCFTALGLRDINPFQPSLPFDYIGNCNENSLLIVFEILDQLKQNILNIEKFIAVDQNLYNTSKFHLGHFYKQGYKHLKLRSDNEKEARESVLELFNKRFHRLKNNFFTQPNLIFYSRNRTLNETDDSIRNAAKLIISLNPNNYLVILGNHTSFHLLDNIEFVRHKRRSSKTIKRHIEFYISSLSSETIQHYTSFIPDINC